MVTVILTAGCAKYRYNKLGLGDIGGISPNVAKVLIDTFGIAGIGTVEDDIKLFMA